MAGIVDGVTVKLYKQDGKIFIHPDDQEVCQMYHAYGEKCPCEFWPYMAAGFLPVGWHVQRVPMMTETGFMLTYHGKYYEVLSLE